MLAIAVTLKSRLAIDYFVATLGTELDAVRDAFDFDGHKAFFVFELLVDHLGETGETDKMGKVLQNV